MCANLALECTNPAHDGGIKVRLVHERIARAVLPTGNCASKRSPEDYAASYLLPLQWLLCFLIAAPSVITAPWCLKTFLVSRLRRNRRTQVSDHSRKHNLRRSKPRTPVGDRKAPCHPKGARDHVANDVIDTLHRKGLNFFFFLRERQRGRRNPCSLDFLYFPALHSCKILPASMVV